MPKTNVSQTQNEFQNKNAAIQRILKRAKTYVTIEPVIVFYILPSILAGLTIQNLSLDKACRVNLKFNVETCNALASRNASLYTQHEEIAVQKLVTTMFAWKSFVQSLVPAILLLFLGSWSDRHRRRKPFVLFPILGEILSCTGFLLCTYFYLELPMEFIGISEALPPALTGGWFTMFMASFSYIADICSIERRTARIGVMHVLIDISVTLGIALSGILYEMISFYGVFALCLSLHLSAAGYATFWLKEKHSETSTKSEANAAEFFKDLFNFQHVKETFLVVLKNGQNNRKTKVCLIFVLVFVISGPLYGEIGVMYLYVRYRFNWNEMDYSIYSTYKVLLNLFGMSIFLALFSKYLKLDDSLLGMIATISRFLACFVYALAPTPTIFYLGPVVEIFGGMAHIAMRSIITKLVVSDELGKVNSLFGVCEALVPLAYGPMYSILYKSTIKILPGAFLLAGGFLTFPATLIFWWLYVQHRRDLKEEKLDLPLKTELLKLECPQNTLDLTESNY